MEGRKSLVINSFRMLFFLLEFLKLSAELWQAETFTNGKICEMFAFRGQKLSRMQHQKDFANMNIRESMLLENFQKLT